MLNLRMKTRYRNDKRSPKNVAIEKIYKTKIYGYLDITAIILDMNDREEL